MAELSIDEPAKPRDTTVLEPSHGWRQLGLRELWDHRELLLFFVWRDIKLRYRQTFFGAAWAVLQPVLLMAIFSVTLGRLPGVGPAGVPYPLFVFAGLVPWTFFAQSLTGASNSLVGGEAIITKVYFPRLVLPFAAVGSFLLDLLIAIAVLGLLMAGFGVTPGLPALWIIPLALLAVVSALGVGTWLAAVNVRFRDVKYVVPFLVQIWFFTTPVIYTSGLISPQWRELYALNPMTGVVEGFRWALLGGPRPDGLIVVSAVAAVLILASGLLYFRRAERAFADII
jgi:lipopolysaccharide transport system permease protein